MEMGDSFSSTILDNANKRTDSTIQKNPINELSDSLTFSRLHTIKKSQCSRTQFIFHFFPSNRILAIFIRFILNFTILCFLYLFDIRIFEENEKQMPVSVSQYHNLHEDLAVAMEMGDSFYFWYYLL
jgi:hypothetical protein